MTFIDVIIILIMIIGLIIGWNGGFFKTAIDIFSLFVSMVIAGLLKGPLGNLLASFIPFMNMKGLYSLNIIMYQLIAYFLILLLVLGIYQGIMKRSKLDDKISDKSLTAQLPSKLIGAVLGIALSIIFTYNILLVVKFPSFDGSWIRDSYFTSRVLENSFMLSDINKKLYDASDEAAIIISENKNEYKKYIDTKIVEYFIDIDLISYEKVDELRLNGSLPEYYDKKKKTKTNTGIRVKVTEEGAEITDE